MKQAIIVFILAVGGWSDGQNTQCSPSRRRKSLRGRFNQFFFQSSFQPLLSSVRLLAGFACFAVLSFCQSNSADGQSACPCGCGGVGGHVGGQAFRGPALAQTSDEIDARIFNRWTTTATDSSTGTTGDAVTLTWGIVNEGTPLPTTPLGSAPDEGSSFINFLDNVTGRDTASTGGTDLTQRAWFSLFAETTNRISQLSGVTFNFEAADDGAPFIVPTGGGLTAPNPGVLGTRADIRIGGRSVDGEVGPNTLAFAFFPTIGDVVFDTDNVGFYSGTFNDSVGLRNVLAHEIYHALGFEHVLSSGGAGFLMNPAISLAFDGPQLDDILTLQRNYGDFLESSNGQLGNDTVFNATDLGSIGVGGSLSVGQAVDDTVITADEVGFVSINDDVDVDIFEFFLDELAVVTIGLTPEGATYLQDEEVTSPTFESLNTEELNDLGLRLLDANGDEIAAADLFGVGEGESLTESLEAGTYFVEVSGSLDEIQLYTLSISAVPEPSSGLAAVAVLGCLTLRRRRK